MQNRYRYFSGWQLLRLARTAVCENVPGPGRAGPGFHLCALRCPFSVCTARRPMRPLLGSGLRRSSGAWPPSCRSARPPALGVLRYSRGTPGYSRDAHGYSGVPSGTQGGNQANRPPRYRSALRPYRRTHTHSLTRANNRTRAHSRTRTALRARAHAQRARAVGPAAIRIQNSHSIHSRNCRGCRRSRS